MNTELNKNNLKNLYIEFIEEVAIEISIDKKFRNILANIPYGEQIEVSLKTANHCKYLKHIFAHNLVFFVEKAHNSPEVFDEGLTIFKFTSKDFPDIIRYTGNNID